MNLVQINMSASWGSTGRIAEGINLLAQKEGFSTYIAWGCAANKSSSKLIRIGSKYEHVQHELFSRLFDCQGRGSIIPTCRFINKLDLIHPDLIHLHNIHGSYINYNILFEYLKEKRLPVVWTLHDCWSFTGHCAFFTFCDCSKWKTGCFDCPQPHTYPKSYFLDRSRDNFELKKKVFNSIPNISIVPVSHWLDRLVGQSFLKTHPHSVIHNGIDTDAFSPASNITKTKQSLGIQQDETMILGVAHVWSKRKGLSDFIELSKKLSTRQKLVLVGLTKKQIKTLPENIIGIERTESIKQLAEFYSAADIFLNLTYEDNYPTTNLEAISCGTPCLTYQTGGGPESITSETGFVVPQGDIYSVLNCIEIVRKNGRESYSSACRNYALAHFRQEDRYREYVDLYKQILHI